MTRRYADPVAVELAPAEFAPAEFMSAGLAAVETVLRPGGGEPEVLRAFRWRARRYVVREVLACWVAASVWWRPFTATRRSRAEGPGDERSGDRTVWRVETDGGVFDLARDSDTGQWSVVQVHD